MQYQLGFIGCGNMGGALAQAAAKTLVPNTIAVCDFCEEKVAAMSALGMTPSTAEEIAAQAKFVVMAVKPQFMQDAITPIANILRNREDITVITMAAGLSIQAIRSFIGKDLPVIRIMPNTPVLVGEGMILYAAEGVERSAEEEFLTAFSKAGIFDKIPESSIDSGSALSGCGPAFVYAFIQALADGGVASGVEEEKALLYAAQTALGAAKMALQFKDTKTLIKNVCSPGGTTIEGVKTLEQENLQGVVVDAVKASYKRTLELKK